MGNYGHSRRIEQRSRLFIGIPIPVSLHKEISQWREQYEKKLPVRWVPLDNLHITVVPPWDEEHPGKPLKRLAKLVLGVRPFSLEFHMVSFGPTRGRPRLIWAEGDLTEPFEFVCRTVAKTLKKPRPRSDLLVHLTLARFHPRDYVLFDVQHLNDCVSWRMEVKTIILYESHLLPGGAHYEELGEFPI